MTGGRGSSSLSKSEARCSTVPSPCAVQCSTVWEGGGRHDGRQADLYHSQRVRPGAVRYRHPAQYSVVQCGRGGGDMTGGKRIFITLKE